MLLSIEKILILKSVMMFSAVPEEYLADLASRASEVELEPGQRIINEGELGSALYVIVSGRVRVVRAERTIAVRGPRDVIGELTVFDPRPRSASVEALEATHALQLEGEAVEGLMSENIEVLRAIVRMLSRRLRESTERMARGEPTGPPGPS